MLLEGLNEVAILGAGEMGTNIATVCALAGYPVMIRDLRVELLEDCERRIRRNLDSLLEAEEINPADVTAALSRVRTTLDIKSAVATAGLVIEAVFEDLALKQGVFRELEALAPADATLATNSAGIPTTQIASACVEPGRVVGIHFFNPPFIFRAVEAIRGQETSDATFERAIGFIESIGSVPIRVFKDRERFVINTLQISLAQVAAGLVADGVTTYEDIDRAIEWSFGPRYAAHGVFRGTEMIRPGTPLRRGVMKGEGLVYDYSAYTTEELFRRRDLSFLKVLRAAAEARKEFPIE